MAIDASEIVVRICRYAASNHIPLGSVRLQKLVYLLECESYRWDRKRLTDLDWKFFHYGPWSSSLADISKTKFHVEPELLSDGRQFHGITYSESEFNRLPDRFSDPSLQGVFLTIMEAWAIVPLEELLDHVYFHTPPMENASRGNILDFTTIPSARDERVAINPFETLSRDRHEKLRKIAERWANREPRKKPIQFLGDSFLADAMVEMDADEKMDSISLRIELSDSSVDELRKGCDGG